MTIRVLFFAHLRDYAEADSIELQVSSDSVLLARDLLNIMHGHVPDALIEVLRDESAMVSVNHKYAGWDGTVSDGDEVGILPPVSGG